MPRKRSQRELAAIASKRGLVKHGLAAGEDPLKRSNEDSRYLLNVRAASNTTLSDSVRIKALNKAEEIGNKEILDRIIGKRALELQLKGVPQAEALSIANEQVARDTGLARSSKVSAV